MNIANTEEMDWEKQGSPKGRFCVYRKNISKALGGLKDVGTFGGGHPFDVELVRLPPGATNWPFHSHSAQWEMYLVLDGRGLARCDDDSFPIQTGDSFVCRPGMAHQIINNGETDLTYYIIADHALADIVHYPDSNKYFLKPHRKVLANHGEIDYYHGEE